MLCAKMRAPLARKPRLAACARPTKYEKEAHEAKMAKTAVSLEDLDDEKRHRRRNTLIGALALGATIIFSLASCVAVASETNAMQQIADRQEACDRDQLRLRCGEDVADALEPLALAFVAVFPTREGDPVPDQPVQPAALIGLGSDLGKAGAVCSAAGMTIEAGTENFGAALSGLLRASVGTVPEQQEGPRALQTALGEYLVIDLTGMNQFFETEVGEFTSGDE